MSGDLLYGLRQILSSVTWILFGHFFRVPALLRSCCSVPYLLRVHPRIDWRMKYNPFCTINEVFSIRAPFLLLLPARRINYVTNGEQHTKISIIAKTGWVWKMENVPSKLNKSSSSRVGCEGCANSCFSFSSASTEDWAETGRRGVEDNCAISASYLAKENDDTHHVVSLFNAKMVQVECAGMVYEDSRTNQWLYCPW